MTRLSVCRVTVRTCGSVCHVGVYDVWECMTRGSVCRVKVRTCGSVCRVECMTCEGVWRFGMYAVSVCDVFGVYAVWEL